MFPCRGPTLSSTRVRPWLFHQLCQDDNYWTMSVQVFMGSFRSNYKLYTIFSSNTYSHSAESAAGLKQELFNQSQFSTSFVSLQCWKHTHLNNSKHLSISPASRAPHSFAGKTYYVEDFVGATNISANHRYNAILPFLYVQFYVVAGLRLWSGKV